MYRIISHTADVGLEVKSETLVDLFVEAGLGVQWIMFGREIPKGDLLKKISMKADTLEDLLVCWLSELNFMASYKDTIASAIRGLNIERSDTGYDLNAKLLCIDNSDKGIEILDEIKAVTQHNLKIEKIDNATFSVVIIFDL